MGKTMIHASIARHAMTHTLPMNTPGIDRERVMNFVTHNISGAERLLDAAIAAGRDTFTVPLPEKAAFARSDKSIDIISYLAAVGETRRHIEGLGYLVEAKNNKGNYRLIVTIPGGASRS